MNEFIIFCIGRIKLFDCYNMPTVHQIKIYKNMIFITQWKENSLWCNAYKIIINFIKFDCSYIWVFFKVKFSCVFLEFKHKTKIQQCVFLSFPYLVWKWQTCIRLMTLHCTLKTSLPLTVWIVFCRRKHITL